MDDVQLHTERAATVKCNSSGTSRSTFVLVFVMVCAIACHRQPPVAAPDLGSNTVKVAANKTIICAAALLAVQQAQATLSFYEPFSASVFPDNFSLGKTETNGWTIGNSAGSRGCSTVSSGAALSYEGLATESGSRGVARSANTTGSNGNAGKPFGTTITNGSVYCSFLVKAVTLPTTIRSKRSPTP